MTQDEIAVMVYENRKDMPKWLKGDNVAEYIIDTELNLITCNEKHSEFLRLLKAMIIHHVHINLDLIDRIEAIANEKVRIDI